MQFFLYVEKIMGEMKLQPVIFIPQQKGFDFELFYKCVEEGLYSEELNDEIDFLSNIGFISEFSESGQKVYTINYDFKSKSMPAEELGENEQALIDKLLEQGIKTLADTAMIYYFKNYNTREDEVIKSKIRELTPDLFNSMAEAHVLYKELETLT